MRIDVLAEKWKAYNTTFLCCLLVLWQLGFYIFSDSIPKDYPRRDATGLAHYYAKKFFFFYYHLGYFPIVSEKEPQEFSKKEAIRILEEGGPNLLMEYYHWSRLGDSGRIFMYLPDAWLFNKIKEPEVKTFNSLFFTVSLLFVLIGLIRVKQKTLAITYVVLVGSSPFWLYEVYANQNLFSLIIINFNFLLGLFSSLIFRKEDSSILYKLALAGILVAFFAGMRSEVKSMLLGCALVIVVYPHAGIIKKGLYLCTLLFSFYLVGKGIDNYFERKFNEAYLLVQKKGGIPYTGKRITTHKFWHPVFVFLGDFDTKYGYGPRVNDTVAYRYAIPILKNKYGIDVKYSGKLFLDEYYDSTRKYYKKFDEIEAYETICKDKVLNDIKKDPVWYVGILTKRFWNNIIILSPVALSVAGLYLVLPFSGLLILLLLIFLAYKKQYSYLLLLAFSLPVSLASFLIYSKDNITFNHVYHLLGIGIMVALANIYFSKKIKSED
jgi:hypothetical protein